MRQVPVADAAPVGVIGDGRLARHLTHYLHLLGIPVRQWSRRASTMSPEEACGECSTVLVLIRDDQIEPFIEARPGLKAKQLVHCSGALVTPRAVGAHPLMTFGDALYPEAMYRRIPFILDAGSPRLDRLIPGVPNACFTIPPADRPYYHALCVLAGNMSVLLWRKLFDELHQRFDIPPSAAAPYLEQTAANLIAAPDRALTGPLVRGDRRTIAANIQALEGDPFQAVYTACARAYEQRA
jgi:predicted short-subunit dehydrogenase-like oxidoreductase (DUF2520 family)